MGAKNVGSPPRWLEELQANDRAKGTIHRYKSAVEGFLAWYSREEQRPLTFSTLTPIALVGYHNYVQLVNEMKREQCCFMDK